MVGRNKTKKWTDNKKRQQTRHSGEREKERETRTRTPQENGKYQGEKRKTHSGLVKTGLAAGDAAEDAVVVVVDEVVCWEAVERPCDSVDMVRLDPELFDLQQT